MIAVRLIVAGRNNPHANDFKASQRAWSLILAALAYLGTIASATPAFAQNPGTPEWRDMFRNATIPAHICSNARRHSFESTDTVSDAELLALQAGCAYQNNDFKLALDKAVAVLESDQALSDYVIRWYGLFMAGSAERRLRNPESGVPYLREALTLSQQHDDLDPRQQNIFRLIISLLENDELIEATVLLRTTKVDSPASSLKCAMYGALGQTAGNQQLHALAVPAFDDALECLRQVGSPAEAWREPYMMLHRFRSLVVMQPENASKLLTEMDSVYQWSISGDFEMNPNVLMGVNYIYGIALLRGGNPEKALQMFEETERVVATHLPGLEGDTYPYQAEALLAMGKPEQALTMLKRRRIVPSGVWHQEQTLRVEVDIERALGNTRKSRALEEERQMLLLPWLLSQRQALTLFADESTKAELLTAIDAQQQEAKERLQSFERERQRNYVIVAICIVLLAVIAIWLLRLYLDKRSIEQKTAELARSMDRVRQKSDQAGTMVSSAAHDIRNPLNVVIGALSLLLKEHTDDAEEANIRRALSGAQQINRIINELLDLAQLETSGNAEELQMSHIPMVLQQAVQRWQARTADKDLHLGVQATDDGLYATINPIHLDRVIDNFVSNAVKYSHPGGNIMLTAHRDGDKIEIGVEDEGVGVEPQETERIFQPFANISSKPTQGEPSTGIGLAISKRIVELFGGSVQANNRKQGGMCFSVRFSAADQAL